MYMVCGFLSASYLYINLEAHFIRIIMACGKCILKKWKELLFFLPLIISSLGIVCKA